MANLRPFQVCIDMGDVITTQKVKLPNESGDLVMDQNQAKNYMYDYFLQINLAAVNQSSQGTNQRDDHLDNQMSPSLLQSIVANDNISGSMLGKKLSLLDQEGNYDDRDRIRKQALAMIQNAKPYATVFFRFSHRDAKNVTMTVTQQKQ